MKPTGLKKLHKNSIISTSFSCKPRFFELMDEEHDGLLPDGSEEAWAGVAGLTQQRHRAREGN